MTTTAEALAHGWQLHQAGKWAAAEEIYRQVLQASPADPNAWCYLGIACHDQDRLDEAVAAYRRAIQLQPNFPIAFNNLGNTLRMQRRLDEAVTCFDQALRLKPDYVNAYKNKGTAFVWEGRLAEAMTCYDRALELAPQDAETHKNRGVILLLLGRFDEGWPEYAWRWKTEDLSRPPYAQPLWDGSPLDGKTILLTPEQGLGDTIHFIRYAAVLKEKYNCRVVVLCPKPLLRLLASCPGIDLLVPQDQPPADFDCYAPLVDIPGILRDNLDTFPRPIPYLAADPKLVHQWQTYLQAYGGCKIGLAWQGSPQYQADRMRSIPLAEFAPLGKLRGLHLFGLQKGFGTEQIDQLAGALDVISLGDQLDEGSGPFMDTAAVLRNLDLVITADTSIAHIAGALGVPTWLALAHVPDWRWLLEREDSPWYPTVRLFRQTSAGDWSSVVGQMVDELLRLSPRVQRRQREDYRLATAGSNRLVRAKRGLMLFNRHDLYVGRSLDQYGEYSEAESDLFEQVVRPGSVVVEAGAYIGVHTLLLSQRAGDQGWVYAFEPQRTIYEMLCANLALNGRKNVRCRCEALGDAAGELWVPPMNYDAEANFGGLGLGGYQSGERVPVATIDSLALPRCDLLKVDVEGMELPVLRGAEGTIQKFRPILYVENDRLESSPALIEYILSLGYKLYWHLPPLYRAANFFENPTNVFGNIVSSNMLCIHASVKSSISGLTPIERPEDHWLKKG
jgi:FkbM family methyltransferase